MNTLHHLLLSLFCVLFVESKVGMHFLQAGGFPLELNVEVSPHKVGGIRNWRAPTTSSLSEQQLLFGSFQRYVAPSLPAFLPWLATLSRLVVASYRQAGRPCLLARSLAL